MSDYTDIRFELDDRVGVITLHRPDHLNAFSARMGSELCDALRRCDADDDVRAVVITGEGRAFCAGADFSGGAAVFGSPSDRTGFRSDPFDFHPWDVRKPVIAAVNGHAVGIGFTMTLQCDLRIIAREAKCGIVQNRRGVLPDLRAHWTLPRLVGHARAAELLLTGKMFSGAEAAQWGLATQALPADEVLPAAMELAWDIATNTAPVSVGLSKRLLWLAEPPDADRIDELERLIHLHVMGRPDATEGVMAFLDKREPQWQMRVSQDWPDWFPDVAEEATR